MKTLEQMAADEGRTVTCAKLGEPLPAMPFRPFQNDLGERVYNEISVAAWKNWLEHSKLIVNEYRLDLMSDKAREILLEQCENFLFGEGEVAAPAEFTPQSDPQ